MKGLLSDYLTVQQLVYEFFKFNQVYEMTHANTFLQYNDLQQVDKLKAPAWLSDSDTFTGSSIATP